MRNEFIKRDRTARLVRVANLLFHHHPRGISAPDIAKRIGMNVRTVYRDLRSLEAEVGIAVWQEQGRFGAYKTEFLPPLKLSLEEAVTLFLSARLMQRHQDHLDPHVVSAYEKLASILPAPVARHVDATVATLTDLPGDDTRTRIFDLLATGWASGRKVRIRYPHTKDGQTTLHERVVAPYFIEPNPSGHGRYVIGHDSYTDKVRTFRIERIASATLTGETFDEPDDFDIAARIKYAWGVSDQEVVTVTLRFHDASAAQRVRQSRWHGSQEFTEAPDGTLHMSLQVGGLLEITPWVLGWGSAVEVLEPPELRAGIAKTAADMAARYASAVAEK
jgi:predicted DNA-binding transcriptional regulator YafY